MRHAVVVITLAAGAALAACQLEPAPKKKAEPVQQAAPSAPKAPQLPQPDPTADAATPPTPQVIQASAPCINVAAHVVQVFIDTAKDPAQAAVYEQERMQMTKATAEACERQQWSETAQACYNAAKDPAAIKACENKFPPAPPNTGSAGAQPAGRNPSMPGALPPKPTPN